MGGRVPHKKFLQARSLYSEQSRILSHRSSSRCDALHDRVNKRSHAQLKDVESKRRTFQFQLSANQVRNRPGIFIFTD